MQSLQHQNLSSIFKSLQAAGHSPAARRGNADTPRFVTISRQAGAGGKSLGAKLVEALNLRDHGLTPWTLWDHELVEKVSAEQQIPEALVEAFEDADHSWLRELVESISHAGHHSDFKVYRRVAMTIWALAKAGRAVIVGRGGAYITAGLPGGVHIRLVAPTAYRVERFASRHGVTPEHAVEEVRQIDRNRAAFYERFWPGKEITGQAFTATLNTAELTNKQVLECIVPLVCDGVNERYPTMQTDRELVASRPIATRTGVVHGGAV